MARAGSKGLADKHLQPLLGKLVIDYTLEHARGARLLTDSVVSTDSAGVRNRAVTAGFTVIDRPASLASDTASVQDVMLHAMNAYESDCGRHIDAAVILYGNVAARGADVIDRAIAHWNITRCDSVRSFCPVGKWHPRWMSRLDGDTVEALHAGSIHRRQDLEPLFLHDGAVVVMSRGSLMRGMANPQDPHAMFGVDRRGITTAADETVEIDALRDLYWAEAVLRARAIAA